MSSAEGSGAPGRRAVLVIFGGIVLVFVVAGWLATRFREDTRARMRPPAASASASAAVSR